MCLLCSELRTLESKSVKIVASRWQPPPCRSNSLQVCQTNDPCNSPASMMRGRRAVNVARRRLTSPHSHAFCQHAWCVGGARAVVPGGVARHTPHEHLARREIRHPRSLFLLRGKARRQALVRGIQRRHARAVPMRNECIDVEQEQSLRGLIQDGRRPEAAQSGVLFEKFDPWPESV